MEAKTLSLVDIQSKTDEIPKQHAKLVELIGLEATIKLCQKYGGTEIYIPMMDALRLQERNDIIRKELNHTSVQKLARKYGLSVRQIQNIIKGIYPQLEGQANLFDSIK